MALKVRMQRHGSRNKPFFHVVVTDSRNSRDGKFLEKVGHYCPTQEPSLVELDAERIGHWLKVGARPSDSVRNLMKIKKLNMAQLIQGAK